MSELFRSRADVMNIPRRVSTSTPGETRTKQSFKDLTDINRIMAQYKRTGLMLQRPGASFQDLPDNFDYHDAASVVAQADQAFAGLPAALRDRFGNAPGQLLAFLADPLNRAEAENLGLVDRAEPAPSPEALPANAPLPPGG